MFDKFKRNREVKAEAIKVIDDKIMSSTDAEEITKLMEAKRKINRTDFEAGDILKVVANIAVVAVLVTVEYSHILNQKGSRFIKTL